MFRLILVARFSKKSFAETGYFGQKSVSAKILVSAECQQKVVYNLTDHPVVGVDHQFPTLARSASVPLDPKADEEYDTRSVTSDILPEGQDEQPGCVIA